MPEKIPWTEEPGRGKVITRSWTQLSTAQLGGLSSNLTGVLIKKRAGHRHMDRRQIVVRRDMKEQAKGRGPRRNHVC